MGEEGPHNRWSLSHIPMRGGGQVEIGTSVGEDGLKAWVHISQWYSLHDNVFYYTLSPDGAAASPVVVLPLGMLPPIPFDSEASAVSVSLMMIQIHVLPSAWLGHYDENPSVLAHYYIHFCTPKVVALLQFSLHSLVLSIH